MSTEQQLRKLRCSFTRERHRGFVALGVEYWFYSWKQWFLTFDLLKWSVRVEWHE